MEKMAYLVTGSTGEYSDHQYWFVRVFLKKEDADALCKRLTEWCQEKGCVESRGSIGHEYGNDKQHPPEDDNFQLDYTGTSYGVAEIPLSVAETLKVKRS